MQCIVEEGYVENEEKEINIDIDAIGFYAIKKELMKNLIL